MSNTRSLIIGIFVIIVLLVGAVVLIRFLRAGRNSTAETTNEAVETPTVVSGNTVTLNETNRSNTSGIATITEANGGVRVSLNLKDYPADTLQPANVYMGTCDKLGSVLYPLAPAFNGQSVTTLDTTRERLNSQKPLVIGVLKSETDSQIAACSSI